MNYCQYEDRKFSSGNTTYYISNIREDGKCDIKHNDEDGSLISSDWDPSNKDIKECFEKGTYKLIEDTPIETYNIF